MHSFQVILCLLTTTCLLSFSLAAPGATSTANDFSTVVCTPATETDNPEPGCDLTACNFSFTGDKCSPDAPITDVIDHLGLGTCNQISDPDFPNGIVAYIASFTLGPGCIRNGATNITFFTDRDCPTKSVPHAVPGVPPNPASTQKPQAYKKDVQFTIPLKDWVSTSSSGKRGGPQANAMRYSSLWKHASMPSVSRSIFPFQLSRALCSLSGQNEASEAVVDQGASSQCRKKDGDKVA